MMRRPRGVLRRMSALGFVVGTFCAVSLIVPLAGHVSAVPQVVQNVPGLGSTYVDTTTDGGDWYLVGYGANGSVGRLDSQTGSFNASVRTGSATLDASTFIRSASEIAFAWTSAGGSLPTGGLSSYDKAVSFVLPTASSMTLSGAASPTAGSGASNFSIVGTSSDQSTIRVKNIVGTSGLPKYMFMRNKTLGANYGNAYGLALNPQINNQLDWNPDGQNFSAIYAGHNGSTGYITTGGTSNGFVPATLSIWVRKPAECTETSVTRGSRQVIQFSRLGTCVWTPPVGVSSVDVLVVAGLEADLAAELGPWLPRDDVDRPTRGVAAIEGALRAPQDLDAGDVEILVLRRVADGRAVEEGRHTGVDAGQGVVTHPA